MQCSFAPEITRVKDLKDIEFATPRSPAAAVRVFAVLTRQRYLSIHKPNGGHVSIEPRCVGVGH